MTIETNQEQTLYHYTSIAGLHGMLNTGSIWVSDCRFLNDRAELEHAMKLFIEMLPESQKEVMNLALTFANDQMAHCVFSMSKSPSVLSQWRAYGDDGRGAALGLRKDFLERSFQNYDFEIHDCVYHNHPTFLESVMANCQHQLAHINYLYTEASRALNGFFDLLSNDFSALQSIYAQLLRVKNPAFEEEQEVRLVMSRPAREVSFRESRGLLIPYVSHEIVDSDDSDFIFFVCPEIWLGPKADVRNEESIRILSRKKQLSVDVRKYDCGYV